MQEENAVPDTSPLEKGSIENVPPALSPNLFWALIADDALHLWLESIVRSDKGCVMWCPIVAK